MMDVVYIVSRDAPDNHLELRYSIRSMAKHMGGIDRLIITGHCPPFVKPDIFIPVEDKYPANRARNIYEKVLAACNHESTSSCFIYCSDDIFLLKDFAASTFPFFQCGTLECALSNIGDMNYYKKYVKVTYDALVAAGHTTINFNTHSPIRYDKSLLPAVTSKYDWNIPKGYILKSLYCNTIGARPEYMADPKIHTPKTKTAIARKIRSWSMFSTNEFSFNAEMKETLQELFPEPSVWEM